MSAVHLGCHTFVRSARHRRVRLHPGWPGEPLDRPAKWLPRLPTAGESQTCPSGRRRLPVAVGTSVISPHHLVFRGGRGEVSLDQVRELRRGLVLTGQNPCPLDDPGDQTRATRPGRRNESATVVALTFQLVLTRSACKRGDPCRPRAATKAAFTAASKTWSAAPDAKWARGARHL